MCVNCGCREGNKKALEDLDGHDDHKHDDHKHDDHHHHHHKHDDHHHHHKHDDHHPSREIAIGTAVLEQNNKEATTVRNWLDQNNIKAINIMSSPGSGKTALLRRTLENLSAEMNIAVIVGDQRTDNDAKRLEGAGAKVLQINTHSACHLDATMIATELDKFITPDLDLLIIENVGNLVCPAAFDLGEHHRVALLSVCEGEDKPAKYPVLFHKSDLVLLTKVDLIPHLDWNGDLFRKHMKDVHPSANIIDVSARSGEGLDLWFTFLRSLVK